MKTTFWNIDNFKIYQLSMKIIPPWNFLEENNSTLEFFGGK